MSRRTIVLSSVGALVVAALVVGLVLQRGRSADAARDDAARAAATALAQAWSAGDLTGARFVGEQPAAAQERYAAIVAGLDGAVPTVEVTGVTRTEETATAALSVTWPFGEGWTYDTTADLAPLDADGPADGAWGASFTPALVQPALTDGAVLEATRVAAQRGEVLGRDGAPLVTQQDVVEIGVQPSRTTDPTGLAAQLAGVLGIDGNALAGRITSADPNAFVSVITLRRSAYDQVRSQVRDLPGTVFKESTAALAPTPEFARSLIGTVGQATAEIVEASDGRVLAGDVTGLSGVQRSFDAQLAGTAGTTVDLVSGGDAATSDPSASASASSSPSSSGTNAAAETPEVRTQLFSVDPVAGTSLQLALDSRVQQAADAALATTTGGNGNAALVAIDIPSGDVVAVSNTPATGGDRALTGQYPPGSTFKTVSTLALLGAGLDTSATVACPDTATIGGRSFRNFEGEALGDVPFSTDFAKSCNTAFVGLSSQLDPAALDAAGASVGLGGSWTLGLPAGGVFTGALPTEGDAVDVAAATIGQGEVLASPASMAVVAATIARGSWLDPRLVLPSDTATGTTTDGATTDETATEGSEDAGASASATSSTAPAAEPAPDPARLGVVSDLMREVATSGTAAALADVPGGEVRAKTGTAEYGSDVPPRTHAWVIGSQGDLAFAVLVEDGSSGGGVAVPVAETFLRSLAG